MPKILNYFIITNHKKIGDEMNRLTKSIDLSNLNRPIIVASHPRSGTHLTLDLLRRQFLGCETKKKLFSLKDTPYINLDEILSFDKKVTNNEIDKYNRTRIPLIKTHRLPSFSEPFQFLAPLSDRRKALANYLERNSYKIYVYRDIKSTMISLYYFTPESERGRDIHEFIRQVRGKRQLSRISFWAYHVSQWMNQDNVMVLNYDDLLKETEKKLGEIGQMLRESPLMQMPLLPEPPKSSFLRRVNTFLSGNPVSTAIMSFEPRCYNVKSFNDADDEYLRAQIETVDPGLLSRTDSFESIGRRKNDGISI